jgi:hypothetical protein
MWMFYRIKDFFKYLPKKIKWFFQRGIRGYSDNDVYELDYWFLKVIIPMLKQLEKSNISYPANLTMEEWHKILNKMIFYFTEANEETSSKQNKYEKEFRNILWSDGNLIDPDSMTKEEKISYNNIRHKYLQREKELALYRDKKKQQAFILFSKYFWHLWD